MGVPYKWIIIMRIFGIKKIENPLSWNTFCVNYLQKDQSHIMYESMWSLIVRLSATWLIQLSVILGCVVQES